LPENRAKALDYHEFPTPGKISIQPTKPFTSASDLSLAYTPGVAEPVRAIAENEDDAYRYTNKGNLVAVITDGSAVLGLGNVGAVAGKPVMEGKAVLFKRFANIDVFDIEINAPSTETFIETVVNIAPTFGAINLEDIAAPNCFIIEQSLRERLEIPVFHDDQHRWSIEFVGNSG
jgi:malate dehydrogenase (oxaloacetate-decarboxylating)(NADP+)